MRKRTSLRRWKARCRLGRQIPATAIIEHQLTWWFAFKQVPGTPFDALVVDSPSFVDIDRITEYGITSRLSRAVRVF